MGDMLTGLALIIGIPMDLLSLAAMDPRPPTKVYSDK
jgi:hypothetical protein